MLSADTLWTLEVAGIFTLFGLCGMVAVAAILRPAAREVERQDQLALADQAADFGEPTREDVEADWFFGPRAAYGTADAEAGAAFADLLAPFDLTPEDVQVRYNAQRLGERVDRIRDAINENEVDRFRREIEEWAGGTAS